MERAVYPSRPRAAAIAGVLVAASVVAASVVLPPPALAQGAVVIPDDRVQELVSACSDVPSCVAATVDLITVLRQSNPEVPVEDLVSGVADTLIDAHNDGTLPPEVTVTLLSATAVVAETFGLSELSGVLSGAVELALSGEVIDPALVTVRSASPT